MTHAIGGTVTINGSYRIHTFTTGSSSLVVDEDIDAVFAEELEEV